MKLHPLILATAILLIGAPSVAQYEARPSIKFETAWTDNVFGTTDREVNDTSFRVSPGIALERPAGDHTWSLSYSPSFDYSIDDSGLRGWDHDLDATWTWRITPKWTLQVSDTFARYRSISRLNQFSTDAGGTTTREFVGSRRRFVRNVASAALTYGWSERQRTALNLQVLSWDFSEERRSDISILQASLSHSYQLDRSTLLSLRASWRERTNESAGQFAEQRSEFYDLSLSMDHSFDPTLKLTVSAGPAYVIADSSQTTPTSSTVGLIPFIQDPLGRVEAVDIGTCPMLSDGTPYLDAGICQTIPGATPQVLSPLNGLVTLAVVNNIGEPDDSTFSYFANIGLLKKWERVTLDLNVVRRADDSSSVGASSVETRASAGLTYRMTERLTLSASASYSLREQDLESVSFVTTLEPGVFVPLANRAEVRAAEFGSDSDETTIRFSLRARWRVTERLALRAAIYRYDEEDERQGFTVRDAQQLTVRVGVEYKFKPIQF
jgi:hypothetical protein